MPHFSTYILSVSLWHGLKSKGCIFPASGVPGLFRRRRGMVPGPITKVHKVTLAAVMGTRGQSGGQSGGRGCGDVDASPLEGLGRFTPPLARGREVLVEAAEEGISVF